MTNITETAEPLVTTTAWVPERKPEGRWTKGTVGAASPSPNKGPVLTHSHMHRHFHISCHCTCWQKPAALLNNNCQSGQTHDKFTWDKENSENMGLGACSGVHTPADQGNRAAKLRFDRCVPTQEFIHDNGINAQPTVKNSKQEAWMCCSEAICFIFTALHLDEVSVSVRIC